MDCYSYCMERCARNQQRKRGSAQWCISECLMECRPEGPDVEPYLDA